MKNIALAYCIDNIKIAEEIERQLSYASYRFEHYYCKKSNSEEALSAQLRNRRGPVLLIISDNFLKSSQCMNGSLKLIQEQSASILPIIVDGQTKDDNGQPISVPTQFDRVSDIIKYINYWQDQYLDLRKQKRQLNGLDEQKFNEYLKVMRDISSEVGEFLRTLRNMPITEFTEFTENRFERFFRFVGDESGWRYFKEMQVPTTVAVPTMQASVIEAEPVKVEDIPGINLLNDLPITTKIEVAPEETRPAAVSQPDVQELPKPPAQAETPAFVFEGTTGIPKKEEEAEENHEINEEEIEAIIRQSSYFILAGKLQDALNLITSTVVTYPNNVPLRMQYAVILAQHANNPTEAINQLETILEIEPENENALFLMGQLAELKTDFLLAKTSYEKLVEINDKHPEGFYRLGMVVNNHFPDQSEMVAKYFKKAFKNDPSNADAYYQYANLLADRLKKPQKAIKYFKKTLKVQHDHPFANYDIALLYHQLEKKADAREYYLRAIKTNPELKTPENDAAFAYLPEVEKVVHKHTDVERHTIEALKQNILQLEELLLESRESALETAEKERQQKLPGYGKTVLITGATSGIGRATAQLLAENGYQLILTGRREDRLNDIKDELTNKYDSKIKVLSFDIRDFDGTEAALEDLKGEWQKIDILINNAGKAKGLHPIHEGKLEHWEEMIDTNVKGLLYMTRLVAPWMVARGKGHIINIGSTAGKEIYPNGNVYCATKFAVDALTKAMRLDLFQHNIRVSQVSPGHVEETEFALVRFDGDSDKAKIYEGFKPLTAHDIAETILYIITRPAHVNIQDVLIMSTQQAGATLIDRSGRDKFMEEEEE